MKKLSIALALICTPLLLANGGGCTDDQQNADERQTAQQEQSLNAADRQIGMPRIVNFAQRKLLKNAYEDMDQTILTWVYTQGLDGRFICIGQSLGYGVPGGTQFTAGHKPQLHYGSDGGNLLLDQPEPNGLFVPASADATIVDLVDPQTGQAHTAMMEPKVVTVPFQLPGQSVAVSCPTAIDPAKVVDAKEQSTHAQRS